MSADQVSVYDAIARRRDVRAEFTGELVDDAVLWRILEAAHRAPSVGNSQPWDFVVVREPATLRRFADHVAEKRAEFRAALPPERAATFDPIKIEGIVESGTGVVVSYDHARGGPQVLGRATVPETGLFSTVLAIENLWLAATAEGVGVGWVSFYDPAFLAELVGLPADIRPVAWLCVGPVHEFQTVPDLERFGWRAGRPLAEAVHRESFGGAPAARA
ncbi:5,6-dimethylbenzimidazole synthase [Nocardia farcinica]|uniref:NADH dehydrogenase n=2 Tax=Nocardia farcinica TaxID=37329 RepID=A0A0H5P720_NOCFR|nr:5,6-dimethylbenzimidazole synthase [Nocardia farcinica]AXK88060.1 5,6-dimethylbenzimidazole synthase [Nocardia farcinica]MBF6233909.1 5,6-dimethylbenzimidazole synthase [Nocardia farcinica]MBF6253414.1 5,6-dimethylbenzimidazole synthase [Nocardia farcinica]MBF6265121.1 5,6-dimethylbenzimidazole synthase [Nocardia farcinica]MBF6283738.1 5,6-dimethylbenzimidazole synthase [Nocardia farcinica]